MFEEGLIDIEELDEDLQAELMETHFKPNSTGQIQIESKEDITQRLGRSPDRADAFVMSLQKTAILRVQPTNGPQNRQNPSQTEQKDQQIRVNHPDSDLFDPTEPDDLVGDLMDMDF